MLLSVCSPCYLASQVVERVAQRQRGEEEADILTEAFTNLLELIDSLGGVGRS